MRQDVETIRGVTRTTFFPKNQGGILLPLPTPFAPDGSIDALALAANLKKWSTTGITGVVILGSTGERVHLDEREYLQVIEVAREEVRNARGLAFIVGAGQQSTRGTINEVKLAANAGADAVLVITPHFYRSAITQEALIEYYTAVADSAPVPVILYSMPALTGVNIDPETVAGLSRHENILGVKDSSADVARLRKTVEIVREASANDFVVLTGNGTVLCDALRCGAAGGILAVGCVVPELCIEIFRAVKAGDNERAAALQGKLTPLAQAVTTKYGIGGLKAALEMIGYSGRAARAPLRSPDEEALREIARLLAEAQSATADYSVETARA